MKAYTTKIIETPSAIEVWNYNIPVFTGKKEPIKKKRRSYDELKGYEKVEALKKRIQYYKNKRVEVRRLIDMNYDSRTSFLTLTQNSQSPIKKSITVGNHEFDKFIKRLKRYMKTYYPNEELKYIATWERTKQGFIHYHVILFSFPFIKAKVLEEIWRNGFIKINQINHVQRDQKALYISKYFTKDLEFKDIKKKAYFTSRNLKKPQERKVYLAKNKFDINMFGTPAQQKSYQRIFPYREDNKVDYFFIPRKTKNTFNPDSKNSSRQVSG